MEVDQTMQMQCAREHWVWPQSRVCLRCGRNSMFNSLGTTGYAISPHCFGWAVLGKVLCSDYGTMDFWWLCHYWPFIATRGNVGFSGQISAEQILPTGWVQGRLIAITSWISTCSLGNLSLGITSEKQVIYLCFVSFFSTWVTYDVELLLQAQWMWQFSEESSPTLASGSQPPDIREAGNFKGRAWLCLPVN